MHGQRLLARPDKHRYQAPGEAKSRLCEILYLDVIPNDLLLGVCVTNDDPLSRHVYDPTSKSRLVSTTRRA
jgi:hypothetical protein